MAFLSKWRFLANLAGVLLVALTLSCGGGASNPPPPEGHLHVYNGGNLAMWDLYITPSASSSWGADQLAPSTLIPGDTLALTGLDPDYYDVEARFSDGSWDRVYDVRILDGETTVLTMMNTGNGSVSVFNKSGLTINGIFLTLSTASTWGPNQADLPLYNQQTLILTGISPGTYDLKVTFSGGGSVTYPAVVVSSGFETPIQVN